MTSVLNTSLYLPFGKRDVTRAIAEASIVQDLLCYDTVYVLTDQMEAVGVLAGLMGAEVLTDALRSGAIKFVHDRHILGWPTKPPGHTGVMPVFALATTGENRTGYTQRSAAEAAFIALRGFGFPRARLNALLDAVSDATVEMAWPDASEEAKLGWGESMIRKLRVYGEAVSTMPDAPLTLADINRLIRDIKNPKKNPLRATNISVSKIQTESGYKLFDEQRPIPPKQLAMINLALSDRFVVAHASAGPGATLHTEPTVEAILAARVTAIREAAGAEVDVVLSAEKVYLPVLSTPGEFPYRDLMVARAMRAGREFRSVVRDRDESGDKLLQAYLASLGNGLSGRFGVKLVRWLAGTVVGVLSAGTGAALSVVDSFLVDKVLGRGDARYFVDHTLRRIAAGRPARKRLKRTT